MITANRVLRYKQIRAKALSMDLQAVINKHSVDNDLDIPDYIIAKYLVYHIEDLKFLNREAKIHKRLIANP